MRLTVDQGSLLSALRLAQRFVQAKGTLPVLEAVRLETAGGRLGLAGTDLRAAVQTSVAADVEAAGTAAPPARMLAEYVASLPEGPVRLSIEGETRQLEVSEGRSRAVLACHDAGEFPLPPALEGDRELSLDAEALREAIRRVAYAAAAQHANHVLTGIYLRASEDGLVLDAADGFRLARVELPYVPGFECALILQARAVAEYARLLAGRQDESAHILGVGGKGAALRGVHLVAGDVTVYARALDGNYPRTEMILPKSSGTRVTVAAGALRQAVRAVGVFADGRSPLVRLEASGGRLTLRASQAEVGDGVTEISAETDGAGGDVGLNLRYLADQLAVVDGRRVRLSWASAQSPVEFGDPDGAGASARWVVMPMAVRESAGREAA
jgi:DNA polymerase-3 subunit beta